MASTTNSLTEKTETAQSEIDRWASACVFLVQTMSSSLPVSFLSSPLRVEGRVVSHRSAVLEMTVLVSK